MNRNEFNNLYDNLDSLLNETLEIRYGGIYFLEMLSDDEMASNLKNIRTIKYSYSKIELDSNTIKFIKEIKNIVLKNLDIVKENFIKMKEYKKFSLYVNDFSIDKELNMYEEFHNNQSLLEKMYDSSFLSEQNKEKIRRNLSRIMAIAVELKDINMISVAFNICDKYNFQLCKVEMLKALNIAYEYLDIDVYKLLYDISIEADDINKTDIINYSKSFLLMNKNYKYLIELFNVIKNSSAADSLRRAFYRPFLEYICRNDAVKEELFDKKALKNKDTAEYLKNKSDLCKELGVANFQTKLEDDVKNQKMKKAKRKTLVVSLCVVLVLLLGAYMYLTPRKVKIDISDTLVDKYQQNGDGIIHLSYEDEFPIEEIIIQSYNYFNVKTEYNGNDGMVSGFDPELVGVVQTVIVTYKNISREYKVLISPKLLDQPVISIDLNNNVTWDYIKGADSYKVYLFDDEKINNQVIDVKENSYKLSSSDIYGSLNVCVKAYANSKNNKYITSFESEVIKFSKLDRVYNVRYYDNKFMWDMVNGANSYTIIFNKEIYVTANNYLDASLVNGENTIYITANNTLATNTIASDPILYTFYVLDEITNVKYVDSKITFDEVINAKEYKISIDNEDYYSIGRKNYFDTSKLKPGIHNIKIMALGSDKYDNSFYVNNVLFEGDFVVSGELLFNNNVLQFANIDDNIVYEIYINDKKITETSINIIDISSYLKDAKNYDIYYRAIGDYIYNSSKIITITKLEAPVISIFNGYLEADKDDLIEFYDNGILFNGDIKNLGFGVHHIYAKYIGGNMVADSNLSNELVVTIPKANAYIEEANLSGVEGIEVKYEEYENVCYNLVVEFYSNDVLIKKYTFSNCTDGTTGFISLYKDDIMANKVMILLKATGGEDVIDASYEAIYYIDNNGSVK